MKEIFVLILCLLISHGESAQWVSWNSNKSGIPYNAVVGGHNGNGATYYVIRGRHSGGTLPGKYSPDFSHGYLSYGGYQIQVLNFEVSLINLLINEEFL
jgi:hypothetical protein